MTTITINCDKCGAECKPSHFYDNGNPMTTGYGVIRNADGTESRHCYACCGEADRAAMLAEGRATLYMSGDTVTNWPGSLAFQVRSKWTGAHNWRRVKQTFVRFIGPDGAIWSGRQVGEWSQLCQVRRTKLASVYA